MYVLMLQLEKSGKVSKKRLAATWTAPEVSAAVPHRTKAGSSGGGYRAGERLSQQRGEEWRLEAEQLHIRGSQVVPGVTAHRSVSASKFSQCQSVLNNNSDLKKIRSLKEARMMSWCCFRERYTCSYC